MPMPTEMWVVLGSLVVGVLGGAFGIGGGVFLVPFLVLAADLRPVAAVGVSLFCIIGTSAGAASVALRPRERAPAEANLGLALLLEPGLLVGAVASSVVAQRITDRALIASFAVVVAVIALALVVQAFRRRAFAPLPPDGLVRFTDGATEGEDGIAIAYRPQRVPALVAATPLAGVAAGLFGIGGGVVTVPLVALLGRVPVRATAATTSISLMVPAAAGAAVHVAHGTVPAHVVAAALVGVIPGGLLGARLQRRLPERAMRVVFAVLALALAASLIRRVV